MERRDSGGVGAHLYQGGAPAATRAPTRRVGEATGSRMRGRRRGLRATREKKTEEGRGRLVRVCWPASRCRNLISEPISVEFNQIQLVCTTFGFYYIGDVFVLLISGFIHLPISKPLISC
jgi:hypothetical protein